MSLKMEFTSHSSAGVEKTKRYGWIMKDEPGVFKNIDKNLLQIHPAYQRELLTSKVAEITANWSWLSLGALIIGERHAEYWVVDGQHRAVAALRRSDITALPCLVFQTNDVETEARGFVALNTGRKPVSAISKHKAMVTAGDEVAVFVQATLKSLGIMIDKTSKHVGQTKCIGWCLKRAQENPESFVKVLSFVAEISANGGLPIKAQLLDGVYFLHARCGNGLADIRLANRLRSIGARTLTDAAIRASAFYAVGGANIWAQGMLTEINKSLHNKFVLCDAAATKPLSDVTTQVIAGC